MVKSMTGYGSAEGTSGKLGITIEVRSVNNRYLDCSIRIPRIYTAAEDSMKAVVQKYISRGKVDIYVNIDASQADDVIISINKPLLEGYLAAFKQMADQYGLPDDSSVTSVSRFADVLRVEKEKTDTEQFTADICQILEQAMADFNQMRMREGEKLRQDITSRAQEILRLTGLVEERSPQTVAEYRNKLRERMQELLEGRDIDEGRILTEAAIFADKIAVDEETVRLRSHVDQLLLLLQEEGAIGRKLDFLIQEFNREANTIGSKGNDVEIAKLVVNLKAEIEKIREQVQNIE